MTANFDGAAGNGDGAAESIGEKTRRRVVGGLWQI